MVVFYMALDNAAATSAEVLDLRLPASFGSGDRCGTEEALKADCFTAQLCAYGVHGPAVFRADHTFYAIKQGKTVGILGVKTKPEHHVCVVSLCVDADERESHIGKDLMAFVGHVFAGVPTRVHIASRGTSGGSRRAQIILEERFPKLLRFYTRMGFKQLGTVPFCGGEAIELMAPKGVQANPPEHRIFSDGTVHGDAEECFRSLRWNG